MYTCLKLTLLCHFKIRVAEFLKSFAQQKKKKCLCTHTFNETKTIFRNLCRTIKMYLFYFFSNKNVKRENAFH